MAEYDEGFLGFCRGATDHQLENILHQEYRAAVVLENESRMPDYQAARLEAERRGWTVFRGQRV